MNPVTGIKDEGLHLGIPTFGLMSEMDARVQQFFYTNTKHISFGCDSGFMEHLAENEIDLFVVLACPHALAQKPHSHERDKDRFPRPNQAKGDA